MKLADARQHYYEHSGSASQIVRQLGFAGLALIWIFKVDVEGSPRVPDALVLPAVLVVLGLSFDLLQYVLATLLWGWFSRKKEKQLQANYQSLAESDDKKYVEKVMGETFDAPAWINRPGLVCFWSKFPAILLAYILLLRYLIGVLV